MNNSILAETEHNQPQATLKQKVARAFLRYYKWLVGLFFSFILMILLIDIGTSYWVKDQIYTDIDKLPEREYAVVLGTAKYYPSGSPNLYYKYRLDAAMQVYRANKSSYFLMSGDNKTAYYNEPKTMTNDVRRMGMQNQYILQDYAGYNTLDSIIRADKVFKLPSFTIISQRFHCERALFIAKFHQIDAICFVAKYPEQHYKVRIRELFARTAMVFNLLIGTQATTLEESRIINHTQAKN
ncbi:SanA/YdcF family protein [Ursidibacter arcticus]